MSEITQNYVYPQQIQAAPIQNSNQNMTSGVSNYALPKERTIQDEFVHQKKKNGLFEKLYNQLKNLTRLGTGSKKVEQAIAKAEKGEISEEEARKTIDKYRKSQASSEQAFGDVLSIGASGMTFFRLRKFLNWNGAKSLLNEKYYENRKIDIFGNGKKTSSNPIHDFFLKFGKSKTRLAVVSAIAAGTIGGLVKYLSLKINRIGSEEFKTKKKDFNGAKTPQDKAMYKYQKKETNKARRWANFRNFVSGAVNGLMMPITMLGGAIAGVPAYFAGNSLNRYFIGNHEEKNKSFRGYVENLQNDGITHAAVVAATAVPMVKKARFHNIYDANLKKSVEKLKDATLKETEFKTVTAYHELDDILRSSSAIRDIEYSSRSIDEKINALIEENIFAVKMKQISNDGSKLTIALRENCPASRTIEEAQTSITNALGDGYQVKQLLGVGTVAETYLAKDKTGKDVCIKILKEGITKEKVLADKQKFINEVRRSGKPQEEINNLLRNIDDMTEGLLKELDLAHEMEAAKQLADFTKIANVVKPIEVKNGVYVMEKANGISLASLVELNSAKTYKEALESNNSMVEALSDDQLKGRIASLLKGVTSKEDKIKIIDDYIKQVESRTPEFGDISLTKEDFKALIEEYQHVLVEQFNKVGKNGKILHADIHPGNIFVDINALKNRKKGTITDLKSNLGYRDSNKIFTLIDTGNVVKLDTEQAMRAINLTSYIKNGNVEDLTKYMLDGVEGAALGGHTKEEASKILSDELKKIFFDTETRLSTVTNESFVELASNIMRKHGMIPADTQMTLNKARQSASNSRNELADSLIYFYIKDFLNNPTTMGVFEMISKIGKDAIVLNNKNKQLIKTQENLNLQQLPLAQRKIHKNNPNMLKTNSEDHLTYRLKQEMKFEEGPSFNFN